MAVPVIVPDASVLLKWAIESEDEQDRDRALGLQAAWLLGECEIVVPSLWAYETGNILGMKQPKLAQALLRTLIDYHFEEEPISEIYAKALDIMSRVRTTFYDASYHATAIKRRGTFLTADDRYCRKAKRIGHVAALSAWSSANL